MVVVKPRQVRDFARSMGLLAKTDAVNARVIVQRFTGGNCPLWAAANPFVHPARRMYRSQSPG